MNSLSQLAQQLRTIWKQLGVNQRVSIVVAGLAVIAAVAGLGVWSSKGDYALLYRGLDDTESGRVIASLEEGKIKYEMRGAGAIFVPAGKVYQVRMQLAAKGIPRGEGVGFEIFDKPNFAISDFVQRANYLRAVQGELARTIGQLDQVESARVMIVLPENRLVLAPHQKPTASVFVKVRGSALPESAVNSIRWLVANSVEGLQVQNVSVVDNLGNVLSDNNNDTVAGASNTQLAARKNIEQYLAKKAESMLEEVLGSRQAIVRVSADINWDSITRFEEKFDPEGQVPRSEMTEDENTESTTPGTGGIAGVKSNSGSDTNNAAGSGQASKTKKKTVTNQFEINRTVSNMIQGAGGVQRLSAAVFVAQRFEGTGADRKAVPRSPEDLQKLRKIVQSALGIQEKDATRTDEITLEEIPFNDGPLLETIQKWESQDRMHQWITQAQRFLYPAIAVIAMFLFWRAWKRTRAEDVSLGQPWEPPQRDGQVGQGTGLQHNGRGGVGDTPPMVTVEVLNQLIRENPASMTQAVRNWMSGNAPQK